MPAKKAARKAAPKATKDATDKAPAKPAKKAAKKTAPKPPKPPASQAAKPAPSFDEIAKAAYLIHLQRAAAGLPDNPTEDWLQAERQLLGR
jgi:hypothetical protein